MRRWHKGLAAAGVALAVLVPSGVALAATTNSGNGPAVTRTCNCDRAMLQVRDGTCVYATDGTVAQAQQGQGWQHMSGPRDGSGPQADRALDGTGFRWAVNS